MNLGKPPQPTAPWRPYVFRVHCLVTQRWMKIRLPYAWFWHGDQEYGNPEVESGTIASPNPTPPPNIPLRVPQGTKLPDDVEMRLRDLESAADQAMRGPDTNRGGR